MRLTPRELDKLMLHYAGSLAKERKERGIKLNYVEGMALISMEIMELAREGKHSVAELMQLGREILKEGECMEGVASLLTEVQVEATFPDGTKLVTIHNPIAYNGGIIPGEIITKDDEIEINANKEITTLEVINNGDRPIQVGSHFHFFETNKKLSFDRAKAFGKRLDIPSGTCVRFEPGESKTIALIDFGGNKRVFGFNDLTNAQISADSKAKAIAKLKDFAN
ncbi:urease subunit beta [Helicobacter jaachi]|uniref:Urease subunit alpha n=1 Tax=Helicobacter jaachi TaxID=1677920 RepID=A0A4U8T7V3_9HELI|nr:urease subunit alpha [Helicobacter jaachi]TLD95746.1 urease subunit beta [Helicobacter jaachi]